MMNTRYAPNLCQQKQKEIEPSKMTVHSKCPGDRQNCGVTSKKVGRKKHRVKPHVWGQLIMTDLTKMINMLKLINTQAGTKTVRSEQRRGKPSPSDLQKEAALASVLLSGAGPSEAPRTPLRYSGSDRVFLPPALWKISYSGHLLFGQGCLVSSSPAGEAARQTAQAIQSRSSFIYAQPKPRPKRVHRPRRAGSRQPGEFRRSDRVHERCWGLRCWHVIYEKSHLGTKTTSPSSALLLKPSLDSQNANPECTH
nr:uncharacterized protein LOC102403725 [Bubalus bubalis]